MKALIKLTIVAIVLHGTWRAGTAYWQYSQLEDALQQVAQFAGTRSEAELRGRVEDAASRLEVPLAPERIAVRREENHIYIDASYDVRVELLPRYDYPWTFDVKVEAFTLAVK